MASMAALRIGLIGAGNMAQALAKGFIASGLTQPQHMVAACPPADQHLLEQMESIGLGTTHDNREAASASDVLVLCVKPNITRPVLHHLAPCVAPSGPLVASVALGVSLEALEAPLPLGCRVVRLMPNTPALVQLGASVFSRGTHASQADAQLTHRMLSAVGQCNEVPESYMDAVTGLSGAGPAYAYLVVEALADGGVRMGLPRPLALSLAAQTLMGASKMVAATGKHPGQLKDEVCSPGGCTIRGVQALEEAGIRAAFISAVQAATTASIDTAAATATHTASPSASPAATTVTATSQRWVQSGRS